MPICESPRQGDILRITIDGDWRPPYNYIVKFIERECFVTDDAYNESKEFTHYGDINVYLRLLNDEVNDIDENISNDIKL